MRADEETVKEVMKELVQETQLRTVTDVANAFERNTHPDDVTTWGTVVQRLRDIESGLSIQIQNEKNEESAE